MASSDAQTHVCAVWKLLDARSTSEMTDVIKHDMERAH